MIVIDNRIATENLGRFFKNFVKGCAEVSETLATNLIKYPG